MLYFSAYWYRNGWLLFSIFKDKHHTSFCPGFWSPIVLQKLLNLTISGSAGDSLSALKGIVIRILTIHLSRWFLTRFCPLNSMFVRDTAKCHGKTRKTFIFLVYNTTLIVPRNLASQLGEGIPTLPPPWKKACKNLGKWKEDLKDTDWSQPKYGKGKPLGCMHWRPC